MTLLPAVAIAVVVTWALGGTISRLSDLSFRATAAIYCALAVQLVLFTPLAGTNEPLLRIGQLASYLLVLAFVVANRRVNGMGPLALGVGLNTLAIAVNGGLMPVDPGAAVASGWPLRLWAEGAYNNTILTTGDTHLAFLGDIFALPSSPFTAAISIGDLLLFVGAFIVVFTTCCGRDPVRRGRLVAPLRLPLFRRFAILQLASTATGWLVSATMVAWAYGHDGGLAGSTAVLLLRGLAGVAAPWVGGRLADRSGAARLLWLTQVAQAGLLGGAAAAMLIDSSVLAFGLFTLGSLAGASGETAARAAVVATVGRDDALLPAANGLLGTARGCAMACGALGAGLLTQVSQATSLVLAGAVASAIIGTGYGRLQRSLTDIAPAPTGASRTRSAPWRIRAVLPLLAMFAIATLATGIVNAALPEVLGGVNEALAYGIGIAAIGVGLLVGQALGALLPPEQVRPRTIALALSAMGAMVALAGTTTMATTLLLALVVVGLFDGVTETVFDTLLQRATPEEAHGRIFGLAHTACTGAMMLGFASAPALAWLVGGSALMPIAAAVFAVAAGVGAICFPRAAPRGVATAT